MYTVSKTFSFCYGHRLMNDPGKCGHLHGHTARATIVLSSPALDAGGMVVHFDRLKETIGDWILTDLDHTLLLHENDPLVRTLRASGERFKTLDTPPTAECLARMIFHVAKGMELPVTQVDLWESETSRATYKP